MNCKWIFFIAVAVLLAVAFGVTAIPFGSRSEPPPASEASLPEEPAAKYSPEEIFSRAFWRHPAPGDRIVRAERRETTDSAQQVERWQWYLQIEPSRELLTVLRNPDSFGLSPVAAPRFPGDPGMAPDWFPSDGSSADFDLLQGPAGGLLVLYREDRNTLFATDAGQGFAPPVTSGRTERN